MDSDGMQIVLDSIKRMEENQRKMLSLGINTYHRSKRNEEVLKEQAENLKHHIEESDVKVAGILADIEEAAAITKWLKLTGRGAKWFGGVGTVVALFIGAYYKFTGK